MNKLEERTDGKYIINKIGKSTIIAKSERIISNNLLKNGYIFFLFLTCSSAINTPQYGYINNEIFNILLIGYII